MERRPGRSGRNQACDEWLEMFALSSDDPCSESFLKHMQTCPECRTAWNAYRNVWEALALDADDVTVPDDLKEEVMQAIFGAEAGGAEEPANTAPAGRAPFVSSAGQRWGREWRYRPKRLLRVAGYLLLALGLSAGLGEAVSRPHANTTTPLPSPAATTPFTVAGSWKLVSYSADMPNLTGKATLLSQGEEMKMIIELTGMLPTSGDQAYQAWVLHDGMRYNCGTFRVDPSGKGSLVYDIDDPYLSIDGIGVTLEPDSGGSAPRGPKVAGT